MIGGAMRRFERLSTAAKFLLILTALLLPIGIALTWLGETGIREANEALHGRSEDQARTAAKGIESLIARNALALRVAAAGAIAHGSADPCSDAAQALATAPAISRRFALRNMDGRLLCVSDGFEPLDAVPLVAPGNIKMWVDPNADSVVIRVGVVGGMATANLSSKEMRAAALDGGSDIKSLVVSDGSGQLRIVDADPPAEGNLAYSEWPIGNGALTTRIGSLETRITTVDRLILLLPVLMWVLAALVAWLLVSRLLIRPLKQLQNAVTHYNPGAELNLPRKLGPSTEIQELRDAFGRAITRVDDSERDMASALEGQRRLVREVHHRVKNNLQVVASLLNIHGRSAGTAEAQAAYAGIGRRVGALSIVHRNHYAEMEENRGIALRPLLSELAAELRAGAPDSARKLIIDLELETVHTTQDVAVAVAFLITEIVEYAMLELPKEPIEISLRRTSELTARLTLSSPVLVPDQPNQPEKVQFERIITGLAKQLRSDLDRKLGRYSVDLPVFPNP
jgi:two-component system, sensor histidine kinase PdtaS